MTPHYNSPPNWPKPPPGWVPPSDWKANPTWGPAPPGWNFWVDEDGKPVPAPAPGPAVSAATMTAAAMAADEKKKNWFARHKVVTGLAVVAVFIVIMAQLAGGNDQVGEPLAAGPATTEPSKSTAAATTSASAQPRSTTAAPTPTTKAEPSETKTSEPVKPSAPKPVKYSGQGDKILKIKKPSDGAKLITLTHSGESNFIVDQLDADLEESANLVNEIGNYEGTTILDLSDGEDTNRIKIQADGKWTIKIAEITDATPLGATGEGKGDDVLLYSGGAGVIDLSHKGDSNFIVDFYNGDGSENLVNEIGNYSGESIIGAGPGLLQISADGKWTIKIDD